MAKGNPDLPPGALTTYEAAVTRWQDPLLQGHPACPLRWQPVPPIKDSMSLFHTAMVFRIENPSWTGF